VAHSNASSVSLVREPYGDPVERFGSEISILVPVQAKVQQQQQQQQRSADAITVRFYWKASASVSNLHCLLQTTTTLTSFIGWGGTSPDRGDDLAAWEMNNQSLRRGGCRPNVD
jgi:hypothetical protein